MTSKLQNAFVLIGIIGIAAIGYYLYTQNGDISLNNAEVDNQAAAETAVFLQKLNELKRIQLEGSIISDERFISLIDSSKPVVPVPVGRSNPFTLSN
jgi:hypothetical protein